MAQIIIGSESSTGKPSNTVKESAPSKKKDAAGHGGASRSAETHWWRRDKMWPLFGKQALLSDASLTDCSAILMQLNRRRIDSAHDYRMVFFDHHLVEFLFVVCEQLAVPTEVRFHALTILNELVIVAQGGGCRCIHTRKRFLLTHIQQLYGASLTADREWEVIEARLTSQVPLRALTCVQIASKMHNSLEFLPMAWFGGFLRSLGQCYTAEQLRASELRVLQTLEFRILFLTPVDYLEMLIAVLAHDDVGVPANQLWRWSHDLLAYVYLHLARIMQRILADQLDLTVNVRASLSGRCNAVVADYVLLASGVLTATVCVVQGIEPYADQMCERLHKFTNVPIDHISHVCLMIISDILDN